MKLPTEILMNIELADYLYTKKGAAHIYKVNGVEYVAFLSPAQLIALLKQTEFIESYFPGEYDYVVEFLEISLGIDETPTYSMRTIPLYDFMQNFSKDQWCKLLSYYHKLNY